MICYSFFLNSLKPTQDLYLKVLKGRALMVQRLPRSSASDGHFLLCIIDQDPKPHINKYYFIFRYWKAWIFICQNYCSNGLLYKAQFFIINISRTSGKTSIYIILSALPLAFRGSALKGAERR